MLREYFDLLSEGSFFKKIVAIVGLTGIICGGFVGAFNLYNLFFKEKKFEIYKNYTLKDKSFFYFNDFLCENISKFVYIDIIIPSYDNNNIEVSLPDDINKGDIIYRDSEGENFIWYINGEDHNFYFATGVGGYHLEGYFYIENYFKYHLGFIEGAITSVPPQDVL